MTTTKRNYWVDVSTTAIIPSDGQGNTSAVTVQTSLVSAWDAVVLIAYEITAGADLTADRTLIISGLKLDGATQSAEDAVFTLNMRSTLDPVLSARRFDLNEMYVILKNKGTYTGSEVYQPGFTAVVSNAEVNGRL